MYETIDAPRDTRVMRPEPDPEPTPRWPFVVAIILAGLALGAAGILIGLVLGDDDTATDTTTTSAVTTTESSVDTSTSATTAPTTSEPSTTAITEPSTAATTATSTTTATTTPTTASEVATAVWPWASSGVRYDDPVEAAKGFATDFIGFTNPVAGEFRQGDNRSGEVEIRAAANGPATTVFVRQLTADNTWWVLGSASSNITVDQPQALATISNPLAVSGHGRAFEAVIEVQVRADGQQSPLGTGIVLASGDEDLGPFEGSVPFSGTGAERGAVVFLTRSAADGSVWEAGVVRVVLP
jgi:hypothetical protein